MAAVNYGASTSHGSSVNSRGSSNHYSEDSLECHSDTDTEEGDDPIYDDINEMSESAYDVKSWEPRTTAAKEEETSGRWKEVLKQTLLYIVLFSFVWGTAAIQKGTLVYAAGNVKDIQLVHCVYQNCTTTYWNCTEFHILNLTSWVECVNDTTVETSVQCVLLPESNSTVWGSEGLLENTSSCSALLREEDDHTSCHQTEYFPSEICPSVTASWTWCLFLIVSTPDILSCLYYLHKMTVKTPDEFPHVTFLAVAVMDILSATGTSCLAFLVLPHTQDVIEACMIIMAVGVVPGILKPFSYRTGDGIRRWLFRLVDILAVVVQAVVIITPAASLNAENWSRSSTLPLILAPILMSCGWWSNYVNELTKEEKDDALGLTKWFSRRKTDLLRSDTRAVIYACSCPIKVIVYFVFVATVTPVFDMAQGRDCVGAEEIKNLDTDWVYVWLINASCGLVCLYTCLTASKMLMQRIGMVLPLYMVTPLTMIMLYSACSSWNDDPCHAYPDLPTHSFFQCRSPDDTGDYGTRGAMLVLALLSQLWIAWHVWFPKLNNHHKKNQLFISPGYNGVSLEQGFLYNRNRDDKNKKPAVRAIPGMIKQANKLYVCATLWHETLQEMTDLVTSVLNLEKEVDASEFEAHFIIDDAMQQTPVESEEDEPCENMFVKRFIKALEDSARYLINGEKKVVQETGSRSRGLIYTRVDGRDTFQLPRPTWSRTPYGAQLLWILPFTARDQEDGANEGSRRRGAPSTMTVHLKDSTKIRQGKRWSQVMIFYEILGFNMFTLTKGKPKTRDAENTFLLTLDGDVSFQPKSVNILLELLTKDNLRAGAACGRIRPCGSGPIVWYQQFEYALTHWLQKATEHALGCIVCTPGCFSLFRASALMERNVMHLFAKKDETADEYVKCYLGEDRWLSNLLIKRGQSIKYQPASEAYTKVPETIDELFEQRRRWVPSTLSNMLDLFNHSVLLLRRNHSITWVYLVYQVWALVVTILGPGMYFMLLCVTLRLAGEEMNEGTPLSIRVYVLINLIPLTFYLLICFISTQKTQMKYTKLFCVIYILLQVILLVEFVIRMFEDPCSPAAILIYMVLAGLLLALILHPGDWFCLVLFFVYLIFMPTVYIFMFIYSLANSHRSSWGTREMTQEVEDTEEEVKEQQLSMMGIKIPRRMTQQYTITIPYICELACCQRKNETFHDKLQKWINIRANNVNKKVHQVVRQFNDTMRKLGEAKRSGMVKKLVETKRSGMEDDSDSLEYEDMSVAVVVGDGDPPSDDEDVNYYDNADPAVTSDYLEDDWLERYDLLHGVPRGGVSDQKLWYYHEVIERYLSPSDPLEAVLQKRLQTDLVRYRDQLCVTMLMSNALLIAGGLVLQLNNDVLRTVWPCGDDSYIDPIGWFILLVFLPLLCVKVLGMFFSRIQRLTFYLNKRKSND